MCVCHMHNCVCALDEITMYANSISLFLNGISRTKISPTLTLTHVHTLLIASPLQSWIRHDFSVGGMVETFIHWWYTLKVEPATYWTEEPSRPSQILKMSTSPPGHYKPVWQFPDAGAALIAPLDSFERERLRADWGGSGGMYHDGREVCHSLL